MNAPLSYSVSCSLFLWQIIYSLRSWLFPYISVSPFYLLSFLSPGLPTWWTGEVHQSGSLGWSNLHILSARLIFFFTPLYLWFIVCSHNLNLLNLFFVYFLQTLDPDDVMYPPGDEPDSQYKRNLTVYKVAYWSIDWSINWEYDWLRNRMID